MWATVATSLSQAMTRSRWKKIVTSFFRSLLVFWHHSENWVFLKTVSLHFQSLKWAFTLQWCKTDFGLKRSLIRAVSAQSFKISCSSGNGFWLVYEDLSIDFCRTKFPPKLRYGVQTRLRALLEPAKSRQGDYYCSNGQTRQNSQIQLDVKEHYRPLVEPMVNETYRDKLIKTRLTKWPKSGFPKHLIGLVSRFLTP